MFTLITGGVRNGKSDLGEKICLEKNKNSKLYIATMQFNEKDEEARKRIEQHRQMRKGRGFVTAEKYTALHELDCSVYDTVLIECMGNLIANEMFSEHGGNDVLYAIDKIQKSVSNLVVITNDVFSDGYLYDESTQKYIEKLAQVNCVLAETADCVIEMVCGIPFFQKRGITTLKWEQTSGVCASV